MVGHSKWSKVKRIRGPLDVKRGAAFSKRVKEITVAVRIGSGDLSGRPSLRRVVETACVANMPEENIRWATKRGTGELEGSSCEEVFYEGYAPGGVALATEAATDNKNRTAADLRLTFSKNHGRFAAGDSALCLFHRKGRVTAPRPLTGQHCALKLTLDAGAQEVSTGNTFCIVATPLDRSCTMGPYPGNRRRFRSTETHPPARQPGIRRRRDRRRAGAQASRHPRRHPERGFRLQHPRGLPL